MYATPWRMADSAASGDLHDYLRLWRFGEHYRRSADQLPAVLCKETLDIRALKFQRWQHAETLAGARIWLFRLPSGQIVAALSLDVNCELIDAIDLLEDCYFGDVQIGGQSVAEHCHARAARLGAACGSEDSFLPECHQMVLGSAMPAGESEDLLQRLVYRRPAVPQGVQRDPLPRRAEPPPGVAGRRRPVCERAVRPLRLHRKCRVSCPRSRGTQQGSRTTAPPQAVWGR